MTDPVQLGVSFKMYLGHERSLAWCRIVAPMLRARESVTDGRIRVLVAPSFVSVPAAAQILDGLATVGGQDVAAATSGAFTGEVSAGQLAEVGAGLAVIGHAERRVRHSETDTVVGAKVAAALEHGLTPLVCIGEPQADSIEVAVRICERQIREAVRPARNAGLGGRIIAAYEPIWAIGADRPAPVDWIRGVAGTLRAEIAELTAGFGSQVIYGGSAGPGLLTEVGSAVDGLFLGRFAHDPDAFAAVLDEAELLLSRRGAPA